MLRLIGVVLSIGLADSMNPSTIAPALYMATGDSPLRELAEFTFGVFAAYLLGGAILVLGPGEALLSLVPHPNATTRYILEVAAGLAMLLASAFLWRRRERLSQRALPAPQSRRRSSALLGATISVVELPTAFPYFAAIAAIVGSGLGLGERLFALVLYNVCFVLPLLLTIATVAIAGEKAERILSRARSFLQRRWPVVLAGVALAAGAFVTVLGVTGLTSAGRGSVARFSRHLRHVIT